MIDVSDVVADLAETAVTRRRYATGSASNGIYTAGAATDTTVQACLQVPDARTMQLLAEGVRSRAKWLMHTTADVRTGSDGQGVLPDKIIIDGTAFEPLDVRAYSAHGGYRRLVLVEDV